MAKRVALPVRAFGGEPGVPSVDALARWIAENRGSMADITTYRLDRMLGLQAGAGIGTLCAGGTFYGDRILQCADGIEDRKAIGELHLTTRDIQEDAAGIVVRAKGSWCALPAPHLLGITDTYYEDPAEWSDAICGMYRSILRTMRDVGIPGHVLVSRTADPAELAALSRVNVFFYLDEPDRANLTRLLERQQKIAVRKEYLEMVFSLLDEYDIQTLFIVDPDEAAIRNALVHLDPDQIACGGYSPADDGEYWKNLSESAYYLR